MAKAYFDKTKTGETTYYCRNCDEYAPIDDWNEFECMAYCRDAAWTVEGSREYFIFDSDAGWTITVMSHDNCGLYYRDVEEKESDGWICGSCGTNHFEQDDARRCCT